MSLANICICISFSWNIYTICVLCALFLSLSLSCFASTQIGYRIMAVVFHFSAQGRCAMFTVEQASDDAKQKR